MEIKIKPKKKATRKQKIALTKGRKKRHKMLAEEREKKKKDDR